MVVTGAMAELARAAVRYAFPLYEMARTRAATCPRRDAEGSFAGDGPDSTMRWVNTFVHSRELVGPERRQVVSPNNDTLYSLAWLDLSTGPVCLDVPDSQGRYYAIGLLDFYTNPFRCLGTRTTGEVAARFFLHGPAWRGEVPPGATPVSCPTDAAWVGARFLVDGEGDLAGVWAMQEGLRLTRPDGTSAAMAVEMGISPAERASNPETFVRVVNRALLENPPPAADAALLARFGALGLGLDPVRKPDPAGLALLGSAIAEVLAELSTESPREVGPGWTLPVTVRESFGSDYAARAHVAYHYIGAIGMEDAMYVIAERDADGAVLDGRHGYALHFPAGGLPQAGAFWSLTMYRKSDCMLVANGLRRYSIGDRSKSLRFEPDGGLRLWLSSRPPADAADLPNWLPAPEEGFYVALRVYVPGAPHLNGTFAYPPIQRLPD